MKKSPFFVVLLVIMLFCAVACLLTACSSVGEEQSGDGITDGTTDEDAKPDDEKTSLSEDGANIIASLVAYSMNDSGLMWGNVSSPDGWDNTDLCALGITGYGAACSSFYSVSAEGGGYLVYEGLIGFVLFESEEARNAAADEKTEELKAAASNLGIMDASHEAFTKVGKAALLMTDSTETAETALSAEFLSDIDENFENFVVAASKKVIENGARGSVSNMFYREESGELSVVYFSASNYYLSDVSETTVSLYRAGYNVDRAQTELECDEYRDMLDTIPHSDDSLLNVSESGYYYFAFEVVPGLVYSLNEDDTYEVSGLYPEGSASGDVKVPAEHNGKAVTGIAGSAFKGCTQLRSITLPDTLTYIKTNAFADCVNLKTVDIKGTLSQLETGAFSGCESVESVSLGGGAAGLSLGAFDACVKLKSFDFGGSLAEWCSLAAHSAVTTRVQNLTFGGQPLAGDVTVPAGVSSIGSYAFYNCREITSLTISEGTAWIGGYAFADCAGLRTISISEGLAYISEGAFDGCISLEKISVPDSISRFSATLEDCVRLQYNIYGGVKYLGNGNNPYAVAAGSLNRNITECCLADSARIIADCAFQGCEALLSVTTGDSVVGIGAHAFEDCALMTSVTMGENVESIGDYAFKDCSSLKAITISDSVTDIGSYAFANCVSATSLRLGKSVKDIGRGAFSGCVSVENFIFDSVCFDDTYYYYGQAFDNLGKYGAGVTVTVGDNVTEIPERIFIASSEDSTANIKRIVLGANVEYIPISAIYGCYSIEEIDFSALQGNWKIVLCYDGRVSEMQLDTEFLQRMLGKGGTALKEMFDNMDEYDAEHSYIELIK